MEAKNDNFLALKVFTKASAEFVIDERTFIMKPLVPKKLQELIQIIELSGKEISKLEDFNTSIGYVLTKMVDIFPIIFNETITQDFVNNNMSIPLCFELWEQFVKLNRIEGLIPFFQNAIRITAIPIAEMDKKILN